MSKPHAYLAIGLFGMSGSTGGTNTPAGQYWGVIADSIVGKLLAGENLIIMGTDATGKKTLFRVDGSGMYAYNSRFWMESANGGAFAIDPSFGLGLGQGNPFVVGDDGTIVPKCIDPQTGELKLDKDGFPVGMNLWAGMDGQVYIRGNVYATDGVFNGTVYATDGEFKGIVKATDFQTKDGTSMLTKDGKFDSKYLDLGGIVIDGETGNINFTGAGSITWGNHAPVKYQFGTSLNGPWHNTMAANDKYRRDSLDGGTTWGEPYQFKGTDGKDGKPGSNANVPDWVRAYTQTATYIDDQWVIAPNIAGGTITALDKMVAECDFYVGDNIFLGKQGEAGMKTLRFNSTSAISSEDRGQLKISAEKLDMSQIVDIEWGRNAPKAVFG